MVWKDVKGFEGIYQVSDEGEVRRLYKGGTTKTMKPWTGQYKTITLSAKGKKRTYLMHRLIAETFLGRPANATEVNHKDGDKHNNRLENLEWVTQQENGYHADEFLGKPLYGKTARKVKCLDIVTGETVAEFRSVSDAARSLGKISARTPITFVCQGLQGTAYGYRWEYAD